MKKALLSIFLIVLIFAVAGCSMGGGSNSDMDNQITEDGEKPILPDSPDTPYEPELPDFPQQPEEPIIPDEPELPEEPITPEEPMGPTLLSHINELAENVDETPEFEIKEDITTNSYRIRKGRIEENTTEVDITNPNDNEHYADYILSDRYFWGTEHASIKNANIYIDNVKSIKAEIIAIVTMLNVWVYDMNINTKYRISYDQINDIVYLERVTDSSLYIRISSTYVNGKMVIDAYQYQIYDATSGVEISFHYEEDKILNYYEIGNFTFKNAFLLTADLTVSNPVNVCLSYSTMDQGDRVSYQMFKYLYKMGNESESGLDVYNSYLLDGFDDEFSNFSDTVIINNSNDDKVFSFQNNDGYYFILDLYELKGYSAIIRGDNHYKLVVGDDTFVSGNSDSHGEDNSILYKTDDYSIMAHINEEGTCQMFIGVEVYSDTITPSRVLTEFLDYLGLSFKDEVVYDKLNLLDNSSQILEQYTYFDYSYTYLVSPDQMEQIYQINKLPSVTYQEIMEMLEAEYVVVDEQIEDANYYMLYSNGVSGAVSYNEYNTFNLSNVTITLSDSGILTSGVEYSLVSYLNNGYDSYFLDSQSIIFEGVPVSINLNNNVALPSDMPIGRYHIVAYLTTQIDTQSVRVSAIYTLAGDGEFDVLTTVEKEGLSYFVRVISDTNLVVAMDNMFELKGQANYVEETQYLNLSAISGTLSNGYIMLESDLVSLMATFYDENNEAVKVIEDKFYFGSSALSAVVFMEELPALDAGVYQLKISFNVTKKDGSTIFSADYKHQGSLSGMIVEEQRKDVDAIIFEAFEEYIEFKYTKVIDVDLVITYQDDIIDMTASSMEILYPAFFDSQDVIFLEICFSCDDEEVPSMYFPIYSSFDLLEEEFVFQSINLTDYSVKGGLYKVGYQIIINNQNGESKFDKTYTTEFEFNISSTTTDNVVEQ